jgi:hypothetical protein
LGYSLLRSSFHLRSGAHTVNKHTRHRASRWVKDTHLHGFGNLLFIATVILGNLLGGLEVIGSGFHDYPPRNVL